MNKLYVNGSAHVCAAQCVNDYTCAKDDPLYGHFQTKPHPDNLALSWAKFLSDAVRMPLVMGARTDNTISDIIQQTTEYVENNQNDLIIIGWSIPNETATKIHDDIWKLRKLLASRDIRHVFFNVDIIFDGDVLKKHNWGFRYFNAYNSSYTHYCEMHDLIPNENGYYGKDAHVLWGKFLLNYLNIYKVIS